MRTPFRAAAAAALVAVAPGAGRAAVMTSSLRVTGAQPPYAISYVLGQDVQRLTITIRAAEDGHVVRTFSSLGVNVEVFPADMKQGRHPDVLMWDGRMDNGQAAPPGAYYAHALTTGAGASTLRVLNFAPLPFTPAPGRTEARGLYGGGVNNDPNSPYHNLAYFGVTATNAAGSAGVEVVDADGSSTLFPLPEATATGAYDHISAAVLEDGSVLTAGQTWKRLTLVNPATGAAQAAYASGLVNGRTLRAFGSGASARAYYVSADETGVYLLSPLTGTPVRIVPASALPAAARGLDVRADESALYVSGDGGYVRKFNRPDSGATWTLDPAFNPAAIAGDVRGVALSPNNSVLWIASSSASDAARNRVFGVTASTGVAYPTGTYQVSFGSNLTPQGMAVAANGNIFVEGWRGGVTATSANAVAVLAPPEVATTDQTISNTFTRPGSAGSVALSGGPSASGITYHGATITWNTTVPADSTVQIGTAPGVYDRTVAEDAAPDLATRHSVTVEALDPGRAYYYRVVSAADGYATAISPPGSFTTAALTLSNVRVSDVTDTTARIRWTTGAPATTEIRYAAGGGPQTLRLGAALTTDHDVTLTGLTPGTAWQAVPSSGAGGGAAAVSGDTVMFATLESVHLLTERLAVTEHAATLSWDTAEPVSATVRYGGAPDALSASVHVDAASTGEAALAGLSAGTTYYYQVAFTGEGVAPHTTPVAAFATETSEGSVKTLTTDDPATLGAARHVNVDLGADGHLATLQRQAVPGAPVTTTPLPEARYHHAVVAHNGYLYALGGFTGSGAATGSVVYAPILADGTVGAWTATTPLPAPRVGIGDMAVGYGGRLYVVGGADATFGSLNSVVMAEQNPDGTLGDWTQAAPLPLPNGRAGGTVTAAAGFLYLTGGEDSLSNPAADRAVYAAPVRADGTLGGWAVAGSTPDPARGVRLRAGAGEAFAFGGFLPGMDAYNDSALLTGLAPTGALTPFLPDAEEMAARYDFAAALTGGKLIAMAGRVRSGALTRSLAFAPLSSDGGTGAWSTSAEQAPDPMDALDGEEYNGRLYTAGGRRNDAAGSGADATDAVVMVPMAPLPAPDGAVYAYSGTLESPVLDLGETTNLRRITVAATDDVRARYRFAGSNGVFSDWYAPAPDGSISGGARYVQYMLTLAGDGSAALAVDSVTITTGPAAGTPLPGDVDRDGHVTRADAALTLQMSGGLLAAEDPAVSAANADMDGDGHVTALDAAVILRVVE